MNCYKGIYKHRKRNGHGSRVGFEVFVSFEGSELSVAKNEIAYVSSADCDTYAMVCSNMPSASAQRILTAYGTTELRLKMALVERYREVPMMRFTGAIVE